MFRAWLSVVDHCRDITPATGLGAAERRLVSFGNQGQRGSIIREDRKFRLLAFDDGYVDPYLPSGTLKRSSLLVSSKKPPAVVTLCVGFDLDSLAIPLRSLS